MSKYDELVALIESQQAGKEDTDVFVVGEQLKDIGAESEHNAEILLQDMALKEMNLVAAAAKLKDYADKNHKNAKCFCITPKKADEILRGFYGIEAREGGQSRTPVSTESAAQSGFIDLESFL